MPQQDGDRIAFRNPVKQEGWAQVYHVLTLDQSLSDGALRLYILLLRYARQKDNCWPGQERLAKDLGKSEPTIERRLAELVEHGLITRQQRGNGKTAMTFIEDVEDIYSSIKDAGDDSSIKNNGDESSIKDDGVSSIKNDGTRGPSEMMDKQHEERHAYMHDDDDSSTCMNTQSLRTLQAFGVHGTVAKRLAGQCDPQSVMGWIEYAKEAEGLYNPIAFVVSKLQADEPVPEVSPSRNTKEGRYAATCVECFHVVAISRFCLKCERCRDHCTCEEPEWGVEPCP